MYFLVYVENDEFIRGEGSGGKLVTGVLDWYKKTHPEAKYAVVYTRMAEFRDKVGAVPMPYPDEEYTSVPANAEEARTYFEKVKREGWNDWSMRFHAIDHGNRKGARLMFAMPKVGNEDSESRYAGVFGVYTLK